MSQKKSTSSPLRKILKGLGILVLLIVLFYLEEDCRGYWAWHRFEHKWEAKGEQFDFAIFIPPPVPDDQNFAMTPVVASCYLEELDKDGHLIQPPDTNVVNRLGRMKLNRPGDWQIGATNGDWRKATIPDLKWWQTYYRTPPTNPDSMKAEFPTALEPRSPAADVLLALSKYDSTIEELRQASQLPCSRFPLDYDADAPFATHLPHLTGLKNCVQVLRLRASAELQLGQTEQALADIKLAVRLIDSTRSEPFLISHLVRISEWQLILTPIWEGVAEHRWSDAQLTEIQNDLAQLDFLKDYLSAIRGERANTLANTDYLRRHPGMLHDMFVLDTDAAGNIVEAPLLVRIASHLLPGSFFYENEVTIARMYQQYFLPLVDTEHRLVLPGLAKLNDKNMTAEFQHFSFNERLAHLSLLVLEGQVRRFAYAQSSVDLARVACALERHRLARGEYPESLDALAPQFIQSVPHDIIGGGPLKYRPMADGQFVLYSIGWNQTDDGGQVAFKKDGSVDPDNGDWVWRQPAN